MVPSSKRHLTVIGFPKGTILKQHLKGLGEEAEATKGAIQALMNEIDWNYQLLPDYRHLQQDKVERRQLSKKDKKKLKAAGKEAPDFIEESVHKESVIQMVDMPGIAEFYERMKSELGIDLGPVPPTHITLFVPEGQKLGIGINYEEELAELNPQPVDPALIQ